MNEAKLIMLNNKPRVVTSGHRFEASLIDSGCY